MPTLADSDGLLASLYESGATYEVHGDKAGTGRFFAARVEASSRKVVWVTSFDTREHFPWLVTVSLDDGPNIQVFIHGEHWKGGTQEKFTLLFDRASGGLRSSNAVPA